MNRISFHNLFLTAAVLTLLFCITAFSEEPDKDQAGQSQIFVGPEMVVTAPRIDIPLIKLPGAAAVIDLDNIPEMPKSISPGEALAMVPGLRTDTQYDSEQSHLSIRGQGILTELGIRGIMIVVDGIPINDPTGFAPDMFDIDWSAVEKVEVVKGPTGALFGGGSSAGVIYITTKDGASHHGVSFDATLGSNSFWKTYGEFSGKSGPADYRFSASRSMGDGCRDHSAFFSTNFGGKVNYSVNPRFKLTAILMGTAYFNENPEGLNVFQIADDPFQANPDSDRKNEYRYTRRLTGGITGKAEVTDSQTLSFAAYGRRTEYTESVPSSIIHRNGSNPGANLQYEFRAGTGKIKNRFSLGVDAGWQSLDQYKHPNLGSGLPGENYLSNDKIRQRGYGLYALDWIELGNMWSVFMNLRRDDVNTKLDDHLMAGGIDLSGRKGWRNNTARLGVSWVPRPEAGFYASWGEGFLPPGTNEILANPVRQGGLNQDIIPAASSGGEIGARGFVGNKFSYDASFFFMRTRNDFERYRVPGRPLETFYDNAGRTKRYGLESLVCWKPVENFTARLSYTFNHFTYTDYDSKTFPGDLRGNYLPNSPRHAAYLDIEYAKDGWFCGISDDVSSRSYVDPTNVPYTGGYCLVHARAGYRWENMKSSGELSVALRNAFDKLYMAFTEPDPDGNSYQAGPGREIFVGLRLKFGKK